MISAAIGPWALGPRGRAAARPQRCVICSVHCPASLAGAGGALCHCQQAERAWHSHMRATASLVQRTPRPAASHDARNPRRVQPASALGAAPPPRPLPAAPCPDPSPNTSAPQAASDLPALLSDLVAGLAGAPAAQQLIDHEALAGAAPEVILVLLGSEVRPRVVHARSCVMNLAQEQAAIRAKRRPRSPCSRANRAASKPSGAPPEPGIPIRRAPLTAPRQPPTAAAYERPAPQARGGATGAGRGGAIVAGHALCDAPRGGARAPARGTPADSSAAGPLAARVHVSRVASCASYDALA